MVHLFVFNTNKKYNKFFFYSKNKYVNPYLYMSTTSISIEQKLVQSRHGNKQYISMYIFAYNIYTIFTIKHLDELKQEQNQANKKRNHRN